MIFGKIRCFFTAIVDYIKVGVWMPHLYEIQEIRKDWIWYDNKSWREVHDFRHINGKVELVYIETDKCVYCGKIHKNWCRIKDANVIYNDGELEEYLKE